MHSLVRESRMLNEKGLRTRAGNLWNPNSLYIILHNVFYCGDYRYNVLKEGDRQKVKDKSEWITYQDHHVAIVTREQKERIISILDKNKRMSKSYKYVSEKYIHPFAGLLICGNCGCYMGSTIAGAKKDWQYSKYTCSTRRKLSYACNGKHTSDPVVGEFVFNYILNMLNAQKFFDNIHSPEELQSALLIGNTFSYIDHIDADGLNDLYNMLSSDEIKGEVFGKASKVKKKNAVSE